MGFQGSNDFSKAWVIIIIILLFACCPCGNEKNNHRISGFW